jgi:transcriptional regulator with XRE-family HTH domain
MNEEVAPMPEHYGDVIREERIRKGLSQNKLSKLAHLSRRHLATVESGANISVDVLRDVAQALGITHIDLGSGLTVGFPSPGVAAADLLPIADSIAADAKLILRSAANLRVIARSRAEKSVRNDTPSKKVARRPAAHLVALALRFAASAELLTDPRTISELERDVSELLIRSITA